MGTNDGCSTTLLCPANAIGIGLSASLVVGSVHDFGEADVSVASSGLLKLRPLQREVTGLVVILGDRVLGITPAESVVQLRPTAVAC